jgi:hypothetical protein
MALKTATKDKKAAKSGGKKPRRRVRYTPRVIVKFHDDIVLPYEDAIGPELDKYKIGRWSQLKKKFPGIKIKRLITCVTPQRIRDVVEKARRLDPTYRPPNFLTYFAVLCPGNTEPQEVAKELGLWPTVQSAYVESGPALPPQVNASNNPYYDQPDLQKPYWPGQAYFEPAPVGIDAQAAWNTPGGDGDVGTTACGLQFVDIEQGWCLQHEDLQRPVNKSPITVDGQNVSSEWEHGTEVLGIVAAADNHIGCVGITPNLATVRVVSEMRPSGGWDLVDAIKSAIATLGFGDLVLLESQTPDQFPREIDKLVFDVIQGATALGIIIVEAAGNGGTDRQGYDLDRFNDQKYGYILKRDRNNPGFRDSGAIMVAASSAGDGSKNPPDFTKHFRRTPVNSPNYAESLLSKLAWVHHVAPCQSC